MSELTSPPTSKAQTPDQELEHSPVSIGLMERVLMRFFQESNIRWLLFIGAAIIFGSSLMLVSHKWSQWSTAMRFLTILGYTGCIFGLGEFCGTRLGLRSTANVLRLLTLLLIPTTFLAISWLTTNETGYLNGTELFVLTGIAICGAWYSSDQIFRKLFDSRQPSFQFSYLILSFAGILPKLNYGYPAWTTPVIAFVLWAITSIGILKINRHIFWLTEKRKQPQVFSFFPILLLGSQFLLITTTKLIPGMSIEWIGFGCTLCAIPIILTARTVANIFRQRTGELVYPYPISIVIPIFAGLLFSAVGIVLSAHGFHLKGPTTFALIPSAIIAGGLVILLANDTRYSIFTWIGLILFAVAYQSSPTLFSDLVQQFKATAASAIAEQSLPIAFYGLTYIPYLLSLLVIGNWFKQKPYFSVPMQHFVTLVTTVLLLISFSNIKAAWIIPLVHAFLFVLYAIAYRDRRYAIATAFCVSAVACLTPSFLEAMNVTTFWNPMSTEIASLLTLGCVALIYSVAPFDNLLNRIPLANSVKHPWLLSRDGRPLQLFRSIGMLAGIFYCSISYPCLFLFGSEWPIDNLFYWIAILAISNLILTTVRTRHYWAGMALALYCFSALIMTASHFLRNESALLNFYTSIAAITSALGYCFISTRFKTPAHLFHELREAVSIANFDRFFITIAFKEDRDSSGDARIKNIVISLLLPLCDLALFVFLPCLGAHIFFLVGEAVYTPICSWHSSLVVAIAWLLFVALTVQSKSASYCLGAILPIAIWTGLTNAAGLSNNPMTAALIYSVIGACSLHASRLSLPSQFNVLLNCLKRTGFIWLCFVILFTTMFTSILFQIAGIIAVIAMLLHVRPDQNSARLSLFAILANIQIILLGIAFSNWNTHQGFEFLPEALENLIPVLLPILSVSSIAFYFIRMRIASDFITAWTWLLRLMIIFEIGHTFLQTPSHFIHASMVLVSLLVLTAFELFQAIRLQRESQIWSAFIGIAVCICWLDIQKWISLGNPIWPALMVVLSAFTLHVYLQLRQLTQWQFAGRSLEFIGNVGPAMAAGFAMVNHFTSSVSNVSNWNIITIFSVAAVYSHYGWHLQKRSYLVCGVATFNIAIMTLLCSYSITSIECYMLPIGASMLGLVEVFKRELDLVMRERIRYAGTLTILVSPLFEIVGGSWLHMFILLLLCVLLVLIAIGMRMRALLYLSTAFLLADLSAMVMKSCWHHPSYLWAVGLVVGAAVIALAALAENHRENLLARIRALSIELQSWQ